MAPPARTSAAQRWPLTLLLGAGLIAFCLVMLLAVDLPARGWARVPLSPVAELAPPRGPLARVARAVALNMTPLCWVGYLLLFDGLLGALSGRRRRPDLNPIRARPNRFVFLWLASVPLWCFFDWVNFRFLDAWRYHGLPEGVASRTLGYFVAFAAICPGMFLAAQWLSALGLRRLRTRGVPLGLAAEAAVMMLGVACTALPFLAGGPLGSVPLWLSLLFLLDPLNRWLGAPSVLGDWRAGRWGRTLSLMAGGSICGLCWEFWNYWALAKWTYHLPFLGALEHYRYFEMPWLGFLGFPAFGVECWVALNTVVVLADHLGLRVVESLPEDWAVL